MTQFCFMFWYFTGNAYWDESPLFQLITRTLPFVQTLLYNLTRGRNFCLILVKTRTCKCMENDPIIQRHHIVWMILAQNNHILELLIIVIASLWNRWQKMIITHKAVDSIATQYGGTIPIPLTHFSIEHNPFLTLTSEKSIYLMYKTIL
jgi:hypothetical protein